jgi:hypothetical protein
MSDFEDFGDFEEKQLSAEFLCPISGDVMQDPVIADDGRTYDRRMITTWFEACRTRMVPITSPWTRELISTTLREDTMLKKKITDAIHDNTFSTWLDGISSIHELNAIFAQLDPLRNILAETLKGWQPPQLTVIGAESSGKSSLLQRLVMMPIFPTDDRMCTRMPIHVRLRNSAEAQAPRLEIFNLLSNKTEEGPFVISMQAGSLDVRDKMTEIYEQEQALGQGVSADRIIILHIQGPRVPSLDVVDMPGLVSSPAKMHKQTRALLERHVRLNGEYSMYLAVVAAGTRPNTSIAMEFVQSNKLESRTLGVISRCDEVSLGVLGKTQQLLQNQSVEGMGAVALMPHGWYATMNAPIEGYSGESNATLLRQQAAAELDFFQKFMPTESVCTSGRATSGALVRGLSVMFLEYVRSGWAPTTVKMLEAALDEAHQANARLGLPALAGQSQSDVCLARKLVVAATVQNIKDGFCEVERECCDQLLRPMEKTLKTLLAADHHNGGMVKVEDAANIWKHDEEATKAECQRMVIVWESSGSRRYGSWPRQKRGVGPARLFSGRNPGPGRPCQGQPGGQPGQGPAATRDQVYLWWGDFPCLLMRLW